MDFGPHPGSLLVTPLGVHESQAKYLILVAFRKENKVILEQLNLISRLINLISPHNGISWHPSQICNWSDLYNFLAPFYPIHMWGWCVLIKLQ